MRQFTSQEAILFGSTGHMTDSLLVIGHGSRDPDGVKEFLRLGRMLADRRGDRPIGIAFLEFARPTILEAIDELVGAGARRVICQPGMLFASGHVRIDLPRELAIANSRWPQTDFVLCDALGVHNKLLELCRIRWEEAVTNRPPVAPDETTLLLVGRGSNDSAANASLELIAKRLRELYGVAHAEPCYSGLATPLLKDALETGLQRDCRRIIVQPYFLFTGVLVKQIHDMTSSYGLRHADKEIFSTGHLGVHSLLADAFEERAMAALPTLSD